MQNGRQTSLSLIGGRQTFASQYDNRNYRLSIRKLKTKHTMKREFKKGDRVLVRDTDLQDWQVKTFRCIHSGGTPSYPFIDTEARSWTQCRHIDDFRTGDKVQVRDSMSSMSEEWLDAVYVGYIHVDYLVWRHVVTTELHHSVQMRDCRWHPSMPWAEKEEPLTLEQRVEALERKLNETFNTKEK